MQREEEPDFKSLLDKIRRYNPKADLARIEKAFAFAEEVHYGQKRVSGDAFISHPLAVAHLITDLKLDEDSIVAALLHDTVEDSQEKIKPETIEKRFGLDVALIVDGVTAFRETTKKFLVHQESIDNFRKLLLASVDDVRVLIIRLADKLHNGRTISFLSAEKQRKFAQRAFHLYSPLAEFVSLVVYKRELDDIAFKIIYPAEYSNLRESLKIGERKRQKILNDLIKQVRLKLEENKIKPMDVFGRVKGLWSIRQKVRKCIKEGKITKSDPSVVLDQIGVTILMKDIPTCYAALGIVHLNWQYLSNEFDDYISHPKLNNYQAIQTTVFWGGKTAEIQIKTPEMHKHNEFGPASHIAYKVAGGRSVSSFSYDWVKELSSWKNGIRHSRFKVKVFEDYVYVLTPKGDIFRLEKGSTPVDFAYRLHTDLGHSCCGAKVNGKMVRLDYHLKNGEVVEIISRDSKKLPSSGWLEFVKMKETKNKIRKGLVSS